MRIGRTAPFASLDESAQFVGRTSEDFVMSPASASPSPSVGAHFAGREPNVRAIYDTLVKAARKLGPIEEDPKKTSIHLNRSTAFAGVATQKAALVLTLKSASDIRSSRIRKHEQASANRWHVEVKLTSPADVDAELVSWLRAAYEMSA